MTTRCPKCDYLRQPADQAPDRECPSCGIVYAKFRTANDSITGESGRSSQPSSRQPMAFDTVIPVSVAITAVVALIKGMSSGIGSTNALLLVPFFVCLVPVVSMTFGDGLYQWNRWQMRFERFDSESRPVLAKCLYVFCCAGALIFLGMFYLLKH